MCADLEKRIVELESEVNVLKTVLQEMTIPIIESVFPNTLLMPITGHIYKERLERIDQSLFDSLKKKPFTQYVILDFTALSIDNYHYTEVQDVAKSLENLNSVLQLLGVSVLYCGFQPEIVFELVKAGFNAELKAFSDYRAVIDHLNKEKIYQITTSLL